MAQDQKEKHTISQFMKKGWVAYVRGYKAYKKGYDKIKWNKKK